MFIIADLDTLNSINSQTVTNWLVQFEMLQKRLLYENIFTIDFKDPSEDILHAGLNN